MVDNETGFTAARFFDISFFCVVDFHFVLSFCFGIISGQFCRFFKGAVGEFFTAGFYNDVRSGDAFGVEPPVVAGSKFKGQFFVLVIVLPYINMVAVTADIVERAAGDFCFFRAAFAPDIAAFDQLLFDLYQVFFGKGDVEGSSD